MLASRHVLDEPELDKYWRIRGEELEQERLQRDVKLSQRAQREREKGEGPKSPPMDQVYQNPFTAHQLALQLKDQFKPGGPDYNSDFNSSLRKQMMNSKQG